MLLVPHLTLPPDAGTLADAVAQAVRDGVAAGELVPEQTYSVYQLAELLGVSRSPVREAMLRLAEAGLVRIERNRGFRVIVPTAHDVAEIIEIRTALEPAAARAVAERGGGDDLATIEAALAELDQAADARDEPAFWRADRALHDAILRAAGNVRAARIVAGLREAAVLLRPPTTATGRSLREIYDEHAPVVRAILAREGAAAEAAMRAHLGVTGRLLTEAATST